VKCAAASATFGRLKLLSADEVTAQYFTLRQAAIFIERQHYLNTLETALAADQCFVSSETSPFPETQVVVQINASLDRFPTATATHIDPIASSVSLFACTE
jgi:hypothetical protein